MLTKARTENRILTNEEVFTMAEVDKYSKKL
jgi:hypothetical protein